MTKPKEMVVIDAGNVLETLKRCKGYYKCPESPDGKLLGPLVGYVGRYDDGSGVAKQFVGKVYYNLARAEQHPRVREFFAYEIANLLHNHEPVDVTIGAPMGGILTSGDVGRFLNCRTVFAEKKVTALATETSREQAVYVLDRHEIEPGDRVVVCEDLVNNFTTTDAIKLLVDKAGAKLVAICCVINRSPHDHFTATDNSEIPVVSLLHIPTEQFRQDDPAVAEYIAAGQVIWKPKPHWAELKAAMDQHQRD